MHRVKSNNIDVMHAVGTHYSLYVIIDSSSPVVSMLARLSFVGLMYVTLISCDELQVIEIVAQH